MNSESNKKRSCPSCCLTTTTSALSNILGFYALTGCDTKLIKYFHPLTEVVRDDNVDDDWAFVWSLYGIREKVSNVLMISAFHYCICTVLYNIHVQKMEKEIKRGKRKIQKRSG